jgi:hypothetical protein
MMDRVTLPEVVTRVGETFYLGVIATERLGADLSDSSATLEITGVDGSSVMATTSVVPVGTTRLALDHLLLVEDGGDIEDAGRYNALFTHTFGVQTREVQVPLLVKPRNT